MMINRWLKSNYKQLTIIGVIIVVSIGINAYIGFGPTPPDNKMKSQSNIKADPFAMHNHFYLTIIMDHKPVIVPGQIGIDESLWKNHTLDKYGVAGMPMPGMTMPGMAPLYTNDNSGLIKIGSIDIRNYTLGDFFNIWGMNLNGKVVKASADGKPISDFKNHILKDGEQIHIDIISKK